MRERFLVFLLVFSFTAAGCGARRGSSRPSPSDVPVPVAAEALEEEHLSDSVAVGHAWRDIPDGAYTRRVPDASTVERWKRKFESFGPDSAARSDIALFRDAEHYLAVSDFINLWHVERKEYAPDIAEWRLLQWDPGLDSLPEGRLMRICHTRKQFEALLDYDTGCQWDMTLKAWLEVDFRRFYIQILRREVYGWCLRNDRELKPFLVHEETCAYMCHDAESAAYPKLLGSPEWSGTSFPYRCGLFGRDCLEIEARALELFLGGLMLRSDIPPATGLITREDVLKEYDTFAERMVDDDYSFPLEERRKALEKDREAWKKWMGARSSASLYLKGEHRRVYDYATEQICREKLILLKNRYLTDDGYCMESERKSLLQPGCSDFEILQHDFENLEKRY